MNEELINQSYNDATAQGYNGSIDDFKILISTNEEFLLITYNNAKSGGYQDSFFDFRTLMGVDAPHESVKKKEEEVMVEEEGGVLPSETSSSELPANEIDIVGDNKGVPVYDDNGEIISYRNPNAPRGATNETFVADENSSTQEELDAFNENLPNFRENLQQEYLKSNEEMYGGTPETTPPSDTYNHKTFEGDVVTLSVDVEPVYDKLGNLLNSNAYSNEDLIALGVDIASVSDANRRITYGDPLTDAQGYYADTNPKVAAYSRHHLNLDKRIKKAETAKQVNQLKNTTENRELPDKFNFSDEDKEKYLANLEIIDKKAPVKDFKKSFLDQSKGIKSGKVTDVKQFLVSDVNEGAATKRNAQNENKELRMKYNAPIGSEELRQVAVKDLAKGEEDNEKIFKESNENVKGEKLFTDALTTISGIAEMDDAEAIRFIRENFEKNGIFVRGTGTILKDIKLTNVLGSDSLEDISKDADGIARVQDFIRRNAQTADQKSRSEDFYTTVTKANDLRNGLVVIDDGKPRDAEYTEPIWKDGKWVVVPTLFPKDPLKKSVQPRDWMKVQDVDEAYKIAKERGEVLSFGNEDDAEMFALHREEITPADARKYKWFKENGYGHDPFALKTARDEFERLKDLETDLDKNPLKGDGYIKEYLKKHPDLEKKFIKQVNKTGGLGTVGKVTDMTGFNFRGEDIESLKAMVSQRRRVLGEVLLDDEHQDAEMAYDSFIAGEQEKLIKESNIQKEEVVKANQILQQQSMQAFGHPTSELGDVVASNEQMEEVRQRLMDRENELRFDMSIIKEDNRRAALYFDSKHDKNITSKVVEDLYGVYKSLGEGYAQGNFILAYHKLELANSLGRPVTDEEALKYIDEMIQADQSKEGLTIKEQYRLGQSETTQEFWDALSDDPFDATVGFALNSMAMMLPVGWRLIGTSAATGALAGTAVNPGAGTLTGLGWGVRTGFGLTNAAVEMGASFQEGMQNAGVDMKNPQEVLAFYRDPDAMADVRKIGLTRGIVIGGVDVLTAGATGRVLGSSKYLSKGKLAAKLGAEQLIGGPLGESFGEMMAQVFSGQNLNWNEVAIEGLAAGPNNVANLAWNTYRDGFNQSNIELADNLTSQEYLNSQTVNDERVSQWANNMQKTGKIDADVNQEIQKNIGHRRQAKLSMGLNPDKRAKHKNKAMIDRLSKLYKAKDKLSENEQSQAANKEQINEIQSEINDIVRDKKLRQENPHSPEMQALIDEKENLESSRLTKEKRNRLSAIKEMMVVQLINDEERILDGDLWYDQQQSEVKLDNIIKDGGSASYHITTKNFRGKPKRKRVTKQEFLAEMDKATPETLQDRVLEVTGDFATTNLLKNKNNAIQESSTESVYASEFAEDSGTMGGTIQSQESTIESTTEGTASQAEGQTATEEGRIKTMKARVNHNAEQMNEIANLQDDETIEFTADSLEDIPQEFQDRAELTGETTGTRKILGVPIGKKKTKKRYKYRATGKELKDITVSTLDIINENNEEVTLRGEEVLAYNKDVVIPYHQEQIESATTEEQKKYHQDVIDRVMGDISRDEKLLGIPPEQRFAPQEEVSSDETVEDAAQVTDETVEETFTEEDTDEQSDVDDAVGDAKLQTIREKKTKQQRQDENEMLQEMKEMEGNNQLSDEVFTPEQPAPDVTIYTIEVKENTELANKIKRMGLSELVGKKINLAMADQLKVGQVEIDGKKYDRMGGPFFPLQDKLFGKIAWASINKSAAASIVNGAVNSDYTVVFNMKEDAMDSNIAMIDAMVDSIKALPQTEQKKILKALKTYLATKTFGEKKTPAVRKIGRESKSFTEIVDKLFKLDVDTKAAVLQKVLPTQKKENKTEIGKLLERNGITLESLRQLNVEQFVSDLPGGVLTMVLEIQDKQGKKVTAKTAKEAIVTKEQQDSEGLPKHPNYPVYIRGKAIGLLNETTEIWNMVPEYQQKLEQHVAGKVKTKRSVSKDGKVTKARTRTAREGKSAAMRSAQMTANQARKTTPPTASKFTQFVALLKRAFPSVEVMASQEEFDTLINTLNAQALVTKSQKVYGAVYQGKLYLNPSLANFNTPVHEFGHIWLNVAKQMNPKMYKKGLSLISNPKNSEYVNQVKDSAAYKKIIKDMRENGATQQEIDAYILEEALAIAIGNKGESFVSASQRLNFKNWLNKLFSYVQKLTGISQYTAEEIEELDLNQFVEGIVVDLLKGQQLFEDAEVAGFDNDTVQLMTLPSEESSIQDVIAWGRDNMISDVQIVNLLRSRNRATVAEAKQAILDYSADQLIGDPNLAPSEIGNIQGGMKEGSKLFSQVMKKFYEMTRGLDESSIESDQSRQKRAEEILKNRRASRQTELFADPNQTESMQSTYKKTDFTVEKEPQTGMKWGLKNTKTGKVYPFKTKKAATTALENLETVSVASIVGRRPRRTEYVWTKTKAQRRAILNKLIKDNPIYQRQSLETQAMILNVMDRQLNTRANPVIQQEIRNLRKLMKATKETRTELKEIRLRLRNIIREALPSSLKGKNNTKLKKLIDTVAKVDDKNFLTKIEDALKDVEGIRKEERQDRINTIRKLVAAKAQRKKSVSADTQGFMASAKQILDILAIKKESDRADKLEKFKESFEKEDVDTLIQSYIELRENMSEEQRELMFKEMESAERNALFDALAYDFLGDIETLSVEELDAKLDELKQIKKTGLERYKINRQERLAEYAKLEEQVDSQIETMFPFLYNPDGTLANVKQKARDIINDFKKSSAWGKIKKWGEMFTAKSTTKDRKGFFKSYIGSFKTLANALDNPAKGLTFFTDKVYKRVRRMNEAYLNGVQSTSKTIQELAKSIPNLTLPNVFGLKKNAMGQIMNLLSKNKGMMTYIDSKGNKKSISRNSALRIYALSKNEQQAKKLAELNDINEETLEQIKEELGPELIDFADKIVEWLSTDYYNSINTVYRQSNDSNLPRIENYFPTRTLSARERGKSFVDGDFSGVFSAETAPALKERVDVNNPVDLEYGFIEALYGHVDSMEKFKSHAIGVKEINAILRMPSVKALLGKDTTNLESLLRQLLMVQINPMHMADASTGRNIVAKVMSNLTRFALLGKAIQLFKQASSMIASFATYDSGLRIPGTKQRVPGADLLMYMYDLSRVMGSLVIPYGKYNAAVQAYKMSATFRQRVEDALKSDLYGLESGQVMNRKQNKDFNTYESILSKFFNAGKTILGSPTMLGDILGVLGYMANFRRDIRNGMSVDEAREKFNLYEATQQTRATTEKGTIQHQQNTFFRFFTMFGSSIYLMLNESYQAAGNIKQSIAAGKIPRAQDMRTLFLQVSGVNVAFTAVAFLPKFMYGDDEDKDAVIRELFKAMIGANLLKRLPLINELYLGIESKIDGRNWTPSPTVTPISSLFYRVYKSIKERDAVGLLDSILSPVSGFSIQSIRGLLNLSDKDERTRAKAGYDALGISSMYQPKDIKKEPKPIKMKEERFRGEDGKWQKRMVPNIPNKAYERFRGEDGKWQKRLKPEFAEKYGVSKRPKPSSSNLWNVGLWWENRGKGDKISTYSDAWKYKRAIGKKKIDAIPDKAYEMVRGEDGKLQKRLKPEYEGKYQTGPKSLGDLFNEFIEGDKD
tara:strand:- start:623 stop:11413 length:10791 start_codon:yes stop_codon:yes gene_type:complete